jgi:hypothetical protein
MMKRFLVALLCSALFSKAATVNSNGSASDTQSKITAASAGDTILLPVSGSFTWSADVTLPSTKGVTVDLNGRTITLSGANNEFTVNSPSTGSLINRVTNGKIVRGSGYNLFAGPFKIEDQRNGVGVRVDHIEFTGSNVLVDIGGRGKGVMDNCSFPDTDWAQEFIHIMGWGPVDDSGWKMDAGSTLAGADFIFTIEDCFHDNPNSISGVSWIQGYNGCRIRIRNSTFDFVSVDMHGTKGNLGARWWEVYKNTFDNNTPSGQPTWAYSMRAGSGIIYGNRMTAGAGHAVKIGLVEEDGPSVSPGFESYPALYQIGRGLNQALDPVYCWDNATIGNPQLNSGDAPSGGNMMTLGVDVFEVERPGYTEFVYPHPLRNEGGGGGGSTTSPSRRARSMSTSPAARILSR